MLAAEVSGSPQLSPAGALQLKTAVCYVRVSTDMQTVENQKMALTEYAQANKLHIMKFFEDSAVSGTVAPLEREGFAALMEFIKTNKVDHVLIFDLTRIGRTFWDTLVAIREIERYSVLNASSSKDSFLNVEQESVRQMFISMLAWFAERERDLLVERTKAGIARSKAAGTWKTRPVIEINDELLRALWQRHRHIPTLCDILGISHETLYKILALHGLITRRNMQDRKRFKAPVYHERALAYMQEIGRPATVAEIKQVAKLHEPKDRDFYDSIQRRILPVMKSRGIVDLGNDGKWFIVELRQEDDN